MLDDVPAEHCVKLVRSERQLHRLDVPGEDELANVCGLGGGRLVDVDPDYRPTTLDQPPREVPRGAADVKHPLGRSDQAQEAFVPSVGASVELHVTDTVSVRIRSVILRRLRDSQVPQDYATESASRREPVRRPFRQST